MQGDELNQGSHYFVPQVVHSDAKLSEQQLIALKNDSQNIRIVDLPEGGAEYIALTAEGLASLTQAGISGFNPIIPNSTPLITFSKTKIEPREVKLKLNDYLRISINKAFITTPQKNAKKDNATTNQTKIKDFLNNNLNILFPEVNKPGNFKKDEMMKALYEMANTHADLFIIPATMLSDLMKTDNDSGKIANPIGTNAIMDIARTNNTLLFTASTPARLINPDTLERVDPDYPEEKADFTFVIKTTAVFNEEGNLTGYDQNCNFYPHNADALKFLASSFEGSTLLAKKLVEEGFEKSTSSADRLINSLVKHQNKILAGLFVLFVAALTLAALALFVVFTAPASVPALIVTVIAAFSVKALIGTLAAPAIAGITAGLVAFFAGVSVYLMPKKARGISTDHSIHVDKLQPEENTVGAAASEAAATQPATKEESTPENQQGTTKSEVTPPSRTLSDQDVSQVLRDTRDRNGGTFMDQKPRGSVVDKPDQVAEKNEKKAENAEDKQQHESNKDRGLSRDFKRIN